MRARPRWVLVTDGGAGQSRSAVAAVRAVAAGGDRAAVTVSSRWSLAAASRACSRRVWVPGVRAADEYAAAIERVTRDGAYAVVLPASDAALLALGQPVDHLVDKRSLAERAVAAGLQTPPAETCASAAEVIEAAGSFDYPVVVKPSVSTAPAARVATSADLEAAVNALPRGPVLVQQYVDDDLHAFAGVVVGGSFVAAVQQRYLRTWPVECGTASAAVSIPVDEALGEQIAAMVGPYEGIVQVQLAGRYVLDANPRVYGSLPLAVRAGANLVTIWLDALADRESVRDTRVRARPGVAYRWLEGDARHAARLVAAGKPLAAVRALAPRRDSAHSIESITDPGPLLARLRFALGGDRA